MRVLIVTREYPPEAEGGISRRLSNLVPGLIKEGVDVDVVSFGGSSLSGETVYSLEPRSKILYTRSGEPSVGDAASVVLDIRRLDKYSSRILSLRRHDLVQVEEPVFGPFIATRVPMIVTAHTTQLGEFNALRSMLKSARQLKRLAFSGTVGFAFDRLCLRGADVVVAVGPTIKNELQRFCGVPQEKVVVIPNGAEVQQKLNKTKAKQKLGIDNVLFVYAGRLVDRKRVDDFLKALYTLRREGFRDFSALVVGAGPVEAPLGNLSLRLGLADCVKFTGRVDDLTFHAILEAADVFVLPSCYEGNPISVMEAMAFGCIPVVADIPQMHGIVRGGENGFTYPVGKPEALASALRKVASDREMRASMSRKIRKGVACHSWSAVVGGYLRIYEALLKGSAESRRGS